MHRIRPGIVLAAVVALAILATGCSDSKATADLTVKQDGGLEMKVDAPGYPSEDAISALEDDGWKIDTSDGSWSAERSFKDFAAYDESDEKIADAMLSAYEDYNGFWPNVSEPMNLAVTTQDYFLAKRYIATVTMPKVDLVPESCPLCGGTGQEDCWHCDGTGRITCYSCGGDGFQESWGGTYQCYTCSGTGYVGCDTCGGTGQVACSSCGGSGEPPAELVDSIESGASGMKVQVAVNMPGTFATGGPGDKPEWKIGGDDVVGGKEYTASSWVINWLYSGIAVAVLLIILGTFGFFGVRKMKRAFATSSANRAARKAMARAAAPAATPRAPTRTGATNAGIKYCKQCGAANRVEAGFCASCGKQL